MGKGPGWGFACLTFCFAADTHRFNDSHSEPNTCDSLCQPPTDPFPLRFTQIKQILPDPRSLIQMHLLSPRPRSHTGSLNLTQINSDSCNFKQRRSNSCCFTRAHQNSFRLTPPPSDSLRFTQPPQIHSDSHRFAQIHSDSHRSKVHSRLLSPTPVPQIHVISYGFAQFHVL